MKYQAKCTKCANNSHFSTIIFKIAEKQLQTVTEAELLKERKKNEPNSKRHHINSKLQCRTLDKGIQRGNGIAENVRVPRELDAH